MRGKRFREEQIIGVLKEAEAGVPVPELLRKHGTLYRWKAKYGGLDVSEARRDAARHLTIKTMTPTRKPTRR